MLGKTQDKIYCLYQEDIPVSIIKDSIKMAKQCGLSPEKAAIYALTGAYTMGRIDVNYLTARGFESLIQSMNGLRHAANNHSPDNTELIAEFDNAISNLQTGYEKKKGLL